MAQISRNTFDVLVREYYPRLMGYATILLDEDNARDIVQEVFLYVWEHQESISFTTGIHTYLFKTCWSRMMNFIKKDRRNMLVGSTADLVSTFDLAWMQNNNEDLVKMLSDKDLLQRVMKVAEELPGKRLAVFRLSFLEQLSNSEIAERLDMPKRTVEGHLYHALKYLRGRLQLSDMLLLLALVATRF
ncbi:MAG: sigma-70 family RNA polymerase sigma factor [Bacteroidales bacterium]|nr:sigma-70 family RNA polymerase sigma factor [Bacteroidales bacterium]